MKKTRSTRPIRTPTSMKTEIRVCIAFIILIDTTEAIRNICVFFTRLTGSSTEDNEEMEEIIREIIASDSDDTHNAEEPEEHLNQMEDIQNINEENTLGSHHSSKNNDENSNSSMY